MNEHTVIAIKAGDGDAWELDVLGVPFGGPGNKDSDGEYFDANTEFHADKFGLPVAAYYHGYGDDNRPADEPAYIGQTISSEQRGDGVWYRVALDKANALAKRVWEAAQRGVARASSGSITHLVRKGSDGHIIEWPVVELSIFEIDTGKAPANRYAVAMPVMKARYEQAGLTLPDNIEGETATTSEDDDRGDASAAAQRSTSSVKADEPTETDATSSPSGDIMDEATVQQLVADSVAAALKAQNDEATAAAELEASIKAREEAAAKTAAEAVAEEYQAKLDEAAKGRRLPGETDADGTPHVTQFGNIAKFDDLEPADMAVLFGIQQAAKTANRSRGPSEDLRRALAVRLSDSEETKSKEWRSSRSAMKMAGMPIKANELNQSTLSSYGDEWVGVTYSTQLWDKVRMATEIVGMLPTVTVPQGSESIVIPTAGTSPTFYKVAQASAQGANPGNPTATYTTSKLGTGNQTLTVSKLGAAVPWTGELDEDSLIPWAAEVRRDLVAEAAEVIEHIVIDGDTATGATTNINDIGGTPGGSEAFLLADGFRKLALVTNTANSRDGGAIAIADFLETIKLMGLGGRNAFDRTKVGLIADMHTYWKSLDLTEMKNRDYVGATTIEGQSILTPWGYRLYGTPNMHRANQDATYGLKANSAGKVDLDTAANNTLGAVLGVRWDQWRFGYKRQMTFEVDRDAISDSTTIVVSMRVGLIYRDTDAAAVSYNLTV